VQPVPITTNVVSTNPADGEVYSIQPYIMQFVSDMRQVGDFLCFRTTNRHDLTEILLKVALNAIILTLFFIHRAKVLHACIITGVYFIHRAKVLIHVL
jgi:hypothetical protein